MAWTTFHSAVPSAGTVAPCVLGVTDTSAGGTGVTAEPRGSDIGPAGVSLMVPTKLSSGSGVNGSTTDITK